MRAAAAKSGANAVIEKLPEGYETMLGKWFESGQQLSGGEWQKIALARAFMRDAQILILDEPTSSLDPQAEYEVFARFRELTEGKPPSSSRTASAPCAWPTASWCWSTAAS